MATPTAAAPAALAPACDAASLAAKPILAQQAQGERVWIGLGANLGDARTALATAVQALANLPQTQLGAVSALYGSAPVDAQGPDYLNAVVELRTSLTPIALLLALQELEQAAGRQRPYRNAPRTLDLDVLCYGNWVVYSDLLTLPHPRMAERAFVLLPLADIAPDSVPAAALAAVAEQRIARLTEPTSNGATPPLPWWQQQPPAALSA